jgi:DNA polymerase III subunit beta
VKPSGDSVDEQALAPGQITVTSTSAELGDNQGTLDASVQGEEQLVAFNGRYLRDALESIDTAEVRLEITGPSSPGVLRPLGAEADSYLHVIMPMHVAK